MGLKDVLAILAGYGIFLMLRYVFIKIWSRYRWAQVGIFIQPGSEKCCESQERNGKFRTCYYVSGIRVPYKIYNWF
jgi:hypothetical protein